MKEQIFITGTTGIIGKGLVALLAKTDVDIFILARNKIKAEKLIKQYPNIKVIIGDLDAPNKYINYLSSMDTIYHLGAKTGIWTE